MTSIVAVPSISPKAAKTRPNDVRRLQRNSPAPALADAAAQYLEELDHRQQGRDPEMVYW